MVRFFSFLSLVLAVLVSLGSEDIQAAGKARVSVQDFDLRIPIVSPTYVNARLSDHSEGFLVCQAIPTQETMTEKSVGRLDSGKDQITETRKALNLSMFQTEAHQIVLINLIATSLENPFYGKVPNSSESSQYAMQSCFLELWLYLTIEDSSFQPHLNEGKLTRQAGPSLELPILIQVHPKVAQKEKAVPLGDVTQSLLILSQSTLHVYEKSRVFTAKLALNAEKLSLPGIETHFGAIEIPKELRRTHFHEEL